MVRSREFRLIRLKTSSAYIGATMTILDEQRNQLRSFLVDMQRSPDIMERNVPILCIDECLNRKEIDDLATDLLRCGAIDSSTPLWWELREKGGVSTGCYLGGASGTQKQLYGDIGLPKKHWSFSDMDIVDFLVCHFTSCNHLVLLTENTRLNKNGLREILRNVVSSPLSQRDDKPKLTALFKRGRTAIDQYVSVVRAHFQGVQPSNGYNEIMI
jgi:hypothetical protein